MEDVQHSQPGTYSAAQGFMPLSPLLYGGAGAEETGPFLKISNRSHNLCDPIIGRVESQATNLAEHLTLLDDRAIPRSSASSGDETVTVAAPPTNKRRRGSMTPSPPHEADADTIAVDKHKMLKLIEEQNLQKQRLLRKAEQARLSRKRKKMRMMDLERESESLRKEVKRLKAALAAEQQRTATMVPATAIRTSPTDPARDHDKLYAELKTLESKGVQEERLAAHVATMLEAFRRNEPAAAACLKAFAAQVTPSLPVRFLEWIMSRSDSFYRDEGGLWETLFSQEIGLSKDQVAKLSKLRSAAGAPPPFNKDVIMRKLKQHLHEQCQLQSTMLKNISDVMSPAQLAKLLFWIRKFGEVCIKIRS